MALPAEPERLSDRLRAHRRKLGLSQAQLAARLSTTPQTIGRWEGGAEPQIRWVGLLEDELNPPSAPSVLRAIDGEMRTAAQPRTLTRMQERAVEAYLKRASGVVPMSDTELAGFRTVFAQVGIAWYDE